MKKPIEEKRIVNRELLRKLILNKGRRGKEITAVSADCSASLLEKMMTMESRPAPSEDFRLRICNYFEITEDNLFPWSDEGINWH